MREKGKEKDRPVASFITAPKNLKLAMLAFYHPFARNRNLHTRSRFMNCLQDNHKAKTVEDLVKIVTEAGPDPQQVCKHVRQGKLGCLNKARELLHRIEGKWNPNRESPQRHNLWHTPQRIERYSKADPAKTTVLYNPDTRSAQDLLGGIRIFRRTPGHKSREQDPF